MLYFRKKQERNNMEGIIIGNISNTYKIETIETTYIAHARGKFKNQDIKPLVGDRVEIEVIDEEKNNSNVIGNMLYQQYMDRLCR